MSDLTNGIFALVGTAIGAGIAQIAPIVASVSAGRRRRAKATEKQAQAKALLRRPLYTNLIDAINDAATDAYRLGLFLEEPTHREAVEAQKRLTADQLRRVENLATRVQIDGSERAKTIAFNVSSAIVDLAGRLAGDFDVTTEVARDAMEALATAEVDLVEAARADFGG